MPMLAYAQAHSGHAGHISEPSKTSTPAPASSVDHDSMNMSGMHHGDGEMDHGDMQMQGDSAPQTARDPDAYSGGSVRNADKYALPPSDALMMSATHQFVSVSSDSLESVPASVEACTASDAEAWVGITYNRN